MLPGAHRVCQQQEKKEEKEDWDNHLVLKKWFLVDSKGGERPLCLQLVLSLFCRQTDFRVLPTAFPRGPAYFRGGSAVLTGVLLGTRAAIPGPLHLFFGCWG